MTLAELLEASQRRFCELLRALCEVSGLTQGRMAKLARSEVQQFKACGIIGLDAHVGSLAQPVISAILTGKQQPNYYQLFVLLHVLRGWYESQELQLVGFAHYRHRRDEQTTLYELCVQAEYRGQGIGKALIRHLQTESRIRGKTRLMLKTPVDLPANGFYQHLGFVCQSVQPGKKRDLHVWEQLW